MKPNSCKDNRTIKIVLLGNNNMSLQRLPLDFFILYFMYGLCNIDTLKKKKNHKQEIKTFSLRKLVVYKREMLFISNCAYTLTSLLLVRN